MTHIVTASELASRLELRKCSRDWRGACPSCGYLTSFSVRAGKDDRALAWCSSCQDRDGLTSALNRITAGAWSPPAQQSERTLVEDRGRKKEAARKLWNGSLPASGTLADAYLVQRRLPGLAASPALRYRDDCHHPQGSKLPALVSLVVDVTGAAIATHRTYLDRATCWKANIEPAKASLGPIWTGSIRLQLLRPGQPLVIAEGIESAASAGLLMAAPAWAAISSGNLEHGLSLPPEATDLVIAADPDEPGERAAQAAARRWRKEGRHVRIARTGRPGVDFNNILAERHNG